MNERVNKRAFLFFLTGHTIVVALAGVLIAYHSLTLPGVYERLESGHVSSIELLQSGLRVAIILSLSLVIFGIRKGLLIMWFSIVSLIASQYWMHFQNQAHDISEGRHALSYLRGFIIPTIITLIISRR